MYGQTGSGKTHTLFGPVRFFDGSPDQYGICPRFMSQMVDVANKDSAYSFKASVVEIYFNDCFDLLNNKGKIPIQGMSAKTSVRAGPHSGGLKEERDANGKWIPPYLNGKKQAGGATQDFAAQGCKEMDISSTEDVLNIMKIVEVTRSAKSHALNERSSRSHCIVTLTCTRKSGKSMTTSKFLFVDLAGSERVKKTGAEFLKAEEAQNINMSLTTLGRCI